MPSIGSAAIGAATTIASLISNKRNFDRQVLEQRSAEKRQYERSLEDRAYNSESGQFSRLLSLGMSRGSALASITGAPASALGQIEARTAPDNSQRADIIRQGGAEAAATILQLQQMKLQNEQFQADIDLKRQELDMNRTNADVELYDTRRRNAGIAKLDPVHKEILSWLPKGIIIPDYAQRDSQTFKEWCLSQPKNSAPYRLIMSDPWRSMTEDQYATMRFNELLLNHALPRGYRTDRDTRDAIAEGVKSDAAIKASNARIASINEEISKESLSQARQQTQSVLLEYRQRLRDYNQSGRVYDAEYRKIKAEADTAEKALSAYDKIQELNIEKLTADALHAKNEEERAAYRFKVENLMRDIDLIQKAYDSFSQAKTQGVVSGVYQGKLLRQYREQLDYILEVLKEDQK